MPRKPHVPAYSLHKPSGRAVVKVKGRSIYLGPHGSTESREAYARIVAGVLAGVAPTLPGREKQAPVSPSLSVGELLARYQLHASSYYRKNDKETSEVAAIRCALSRVSYLYAGLPADEFDVLALKTVREALIQAGQTRGTVNQNVGRIVRAFKWGVTEKLYPGVALAELKALPGLRAGRTVAPDKAPVTPVDDKTIEATAPHLPAVVAAMVRFQRATGARPGEVCLVRPCDVDRCGEIWVYTPEEHKTEHHGCERAIYIGPTGQKALEPYLDDRVADEYCFRPKKAMAVPIKQKRYSREAYTRAIARACEKAGVNRWFPNQLRHAFATDARKSYGLEAAQILLGHASADITQIYAERDTKKAIEVARAIG